RTQPGHGAEAERHAGNRAHVGDDPLPAVYGGNVRAPGRLDRLDRAPPPEPSMRRISGSRRSWAIRSHVVCLPLMVASADPPRTVKSSPPTTTGRPSTVARPNTKLDGVKVARSFCSS